MKKSNVCMGVLLCSFVGFSAHADLNRFYQVAPRILRGDQPDNLDDYKRLKKLGVKTIISLRSDDSLVEERKIATSLGMTVVNFPMKATKYPSQALVNKALETITDRSMQPVYVHCKKGKDRTGLIMGLHRVFYHNWTAKAAYAEMKAIGFNPLFFPLKNYFKDHTRGR